MATFAKATFNATIYAASRPSYPKSLFDLIFSYHKDNVLPIGQSSVKATTPGGTDLAIDLGCGTGQRAFYMMNMFSMLGLGQATLALTQFKRVIGVDPSKSMIEGARKHAATAQNASGTKFDFVQSPAEDLNFLENGSVDMIIGGGYTHRKLRSL